MSDPTHFTAAIDIDANRTRLNRYRYVLHEAIHAFAGWLPFELKCGLDRAVWECGQHVNALYLRLREPPPPPEDYIASKIKIWESEYQTGKLSLNVE